MIIIMLAPDHSFDDFTHEAKNPEVNQCCVPGVSACQEEIICLEMHAEQMTSDSL